MTNATATKAIEITTKIAELETAADKQESKEMLNFHGWLKDFKPSACLKRLRSEANKLHTQIEKMAKKSTQQEWDAMIKATRICPEVYGYEALTEY